MIKQRHIDYFNNKVQPEPLTGCWLWTGAVDSYGYGSFGIGYREDGKKLHKTYKAHRFSAMINNIDMSGSVIRHLCHNKLCVNPDHLQSGSYQDNTDDMVKAGRDNYVGRPVVKTQQHL